MTAEEARQKLYDAIASTTLERRPGEIVIDGLSIGLEFCEASDIGGSASLGWQAVAPDRANIRLAHELSGSLRMPLIAQRLSQMLPFLLAYHAIFPTAGEQWIGIDDYHNGPGLAFSSDGQPGNWLIPDTEFLASRGYRSIAEIYARTAPAWEDRRPVGFWRGSTTGLFWANEDWHQLPRIRLCEIGASRPDLLDVGISSVVQIEAYAPEIAALGYLRPPVPADRWIDFRYQIDVDGNSNAWAGYIQRLLTGSPVLKVASPHGFQQWFYDRMQPWRHYVPVEPDMSDLVEKLEWLRTHDAFARCIGEAGRAFALSLDYETEMRLAVLTIGAAMAGDPVRLEQNVPPHRLP